MTDQGSRALASQVQAQAYTLGWSVARRLPARATYRAADRAAKVVVARGGKGVERLGNNLARVRPELSKADLDRLTLAGMRSYLRYYVDSFRLPSWSPEALAASVRVEGDAPVRAELAAGRGVVIALAHQGNWDVAGAWGTQHLGRVVTVAERLQPPEAFEAFLAFRTGLGMEILALGDDGVFQTLLRRVRDGCVVPLLIDRDLSHNGVEVNLFGHRARMARGPAMLADLSGAALHPTSIFYEPLPPGAPDPTGSGHRTVVRFHPPVPRPAGSREERTVAYTQACAAALGEGIREHPEDWHMLQLVFTEDLDPDRLADVAGSAGPREAGAAGAGPS